MHAMFIHPNFPAQFGHIAAHLATQKGWKCTFVTSIDTTHLKSVPFVHCNYRVKPGQLPKTFYNPGNLQELINHMTAVYEGMKSAPQIKPDLVVGHMSYGTMLYLRTLYDCPFVGYFEILPPPFWSKELALRPEFPPSQAARLGNSLYHTFTHLHLHAVDAAYTPTHFQRGTAPAELQHKIRVLFDGIDCKMWQRRALPRPFTFMGRTIEPDTRVVTYVSRGLEAARGFDVFMQVARRLAAEMPNVHFFIAGEERTNYGHELSHIGGKTFKQYALDQGPYDASRFHFLGRIPPTDLVTLYCLSDLHIYLTVPWVLSWSMVQAMATECVVLGSATTPVQEVIDHEQTGLLAGFADVDGLTQLALRVLRDPEQHRPLGAAARARVLERYEQGRCVEALSSFFAETAAQRSARR